MASCQILARSQKSRNPGQTFHLYPHATGRWAKKIKGKLHYFGKTADDPKGEKALDLWLDQKDELLTGRPPRIADSGGPTVEFICNQFMAHKEGRLNSGEIAQRTYDEYLGTAKRVAKVLGHQDAC